MAEEFARINTEAKIHDLAQYTLYADSPGRKGYRASMRFGERNGAPRISVMTNAESGPKVLAVGMAPGVWEQFIESFKEIATGPNGAKSKIVNMQKDPTFTDKVPNFDDVPKVPKNVLHYGKNEEGICWLAIEQKDAARIVFRIMPSAWHTFYGADGVEIKPEVLSARYTHSLMTSIQHAMYRWSSRLNVPWDPDASRAKKKPETSGAGMYEAGDFSDSMDL